MNVLYIGAGFVGACSAAVSADSGHKTLVYDIDKDRIVALSSGNRDNIQSALFEKGLAELLIRNADRITFTHEYTDVTAFVDTCDVVFMCLPTPEVGETGESDLSFYEKAAHDLAQVLLKRNTGAQEKYVVLVNKSTVPINMVDQTQQILDEHGVTKVSVVANPEFLVEGKAIEGSLKPDRVVVGAWIEKDFDVMRRLYQRFRDASDVPYIEVNPREAAAGKLLANYYLFNKLAVCFDVIGRTAEAFEDVQFEQLRKIITTDTRVNSWGFYDSLYAGGSCFIKDARSLSHQLQEVGHEASLVHETYIANKRQLSNFLDRARSEASYTWKGGKVALLGTAFKRDTNDIRNSPSIDIAQFCLLEEVDQLYIYDPAALTMFQKLFPPSDKLVYTEDEKMAVTTADIIIIATDWPQFQGLADMLMQLFPTGGPLLMDGRRMLHQRYDELQKHGFDIIAVGSPFLPKKD